MHWNNAISPKQGQITTITAIIVITIIVCWADAPSCQHRVSSSTSEAFEREGGWVGEMSCGMFVVISHTWLVAVMNCIDGTTTTYHCTAKVVGSDYREEASKIVMCVDKAEGLHWINPKSLVFALCCWQDTCVESLNLKESSRTTAVIFSPSLSLFTTLDAPQLTWLCFPINHCHFKGVQSRHWSIGLADTAQVECRGGSLAQTVDISLLPALAVMVIWCLHCLAQGPSWPGTLLCLLPTESESQSRCGT